MPDYSRFTLAWELKCDMASNSLIDVVQKAIDATGMTDVPVALSYTPRAKSSMSYLPNMGLAQVGINA